MYEQKLWQDHVTEFEDRYTESRNDDGTITHTPVEGEIIQQGTPQNATNFNHMENGISNATETAALMALSAIHHQQAIADLQGETATVTLKNTQQYPFNNSTQSVALKTERNHMDYTVETEIVDYTGGFPGDIVITDKLLNGFKWHTPEAQKRDRKNLCERWVLLMAAGVIIKTEERRQHEEAVMRSFGVQGSGTAAQREAAEVIAARSSEVVRNQNGGRKYYGY